MIDEQLPGDALHDLQYQLFKRFFPVRLILSIDNIHIFLLEYIRSFLLVLPLNLENHLLIDVLDGGVVDLLLELLEAFGDGLHLAVEGLFVLVLA